MTEPAVLAPVLSSLIGLVGILVAALSVYLNYKGRHNQFRQVVYSKQMDAQHLLAFGLDFREGPGDRKQFCAALRDEHDQFRDRVNRWLIVMPSKVKAALDNFDAMLTAIGTPEGAGDPPADLAKAYERVVNCVRHHLAVDSLTLGMLREMGIGSESITMRRTHAGIKVLPISRHG
jgi:hypothetical protein